MRLRTERGSEAAAKNHAPKSESMDKQAEKRRVASHGERRSTAAAEPPHLRREDATDD